jgi:hypothetical protein
MDRIRIVVGNSSLACYPQGGGHWMVFLQYLLGLQALGHDFLYLELLHSTGDRTQDSQFVQSFFDRLKQFGLSDRAALLLCPHKDPAPDLENSQPHGRTISQIKQIAADADIFWNMCGAFRKPMLSLFRRRAFVDLDPGHLQVSGLQWDLELSEHQAFLSVGTKMADADCEVPRLGCDWKPFVPFVYLPMWKPAPDPGASAPFTSVTHWGWDELWLGQRRLSISKRDAYLRYLELPQRTGRTFELAVNIHPEDTTGDRDLLQKNGWRLVHPYDVASSPEQYQEYIAKSRAEMSCPKPIHRELKTGWVSDRTTCYLASGRPAICENTGFTDHLPASEGFIAISDIDEATAAVRAIDNEYERHSTAARRFAEEHLDSNKCLPKMINACW